jgi:hypothetical protein
MAEVSAASIFCVRSWAAVNRGLFEHLVLRGRDQHEVAGRDGAGVGGGAQVGGQLFAGADPVEVADEPVVRPSERLQGET